MVTQPDQVLGNQSPVRNEAQLRYRSPLSKVFGDLLHERETQQWLTASSKEQIGVCGLWVSPKKAVNGIPGKVERQPRTMVSTIRIAVHASEVAGECWDYRNAQRVVVCAKGQTWPWR
jgi:hypothetical protein